MFKICASAIDSELHASSNSNPITHTQQPIVTGTTVIGIKFKNGVIVGSDCVGSYGTLARYKDIRRIKSVGKCTLVTASGDFSDFQLLSDLLDQKNQSDQNHEQERSPNEYFSWLRAIMYQRRNKFDPLWNDIIIAGYKNGESFLGLVDLIGTSYTENHIATGFGAYFATPLIRDRWSPNMEEGEAIALLEDCLRLLFYRDCYASNKIQIAKVTADGLLISDPYLLDTNWDNAALPTAPGADGSSW